MWSKVEAHTNWTSSIPTSYSAMMATATAESDGTKESQGQLKDLLEELDALWENYLHLLDQRQTLYNTLTQHLSSV